MKTVEVMTTGAFSGNVGKLFSNLKLATDRFFPYYSFMQQPTGKPLKDGTYSAMSKQTSSQPDL